jgi:hypothetical protein
MEALTCRECGKDFSLFPPAYQLTERWVDTPWDYRENFRLTEHVQHATENTCYLCTLDHQDEVIPFTAVDLRCRPKPIW